MAYKIVNPKKGISRRTALIVVVIAVLAVGGGAYWWSHYHRPAAETITRAGNFPKSSPIDSTSTPPPKKQSTGNAGRTIGGETTDTNGKATANTSPSQWITSKSGNITVEQPTANATLRNGDTLSGTAKVSTVHFRLTDNSVGVISEGTLNVVNGKFSGSLGFAPHSSTGQLDVFSTDANGVELNEIQIAVRF